jgi:leucyl/phenylalanyl-tRNA--protein transferase
MAQFDARDLLACYARGVFPMADAREDARVFLIDPERRGVIPLDGFHVSHRLARTVRSDVFEIRFDTAFHQVVELCAETGPGRTETWINHPIESLYVGLHEQGFAHSVECWQDGELVGGLYGVSLQGAFFGESMFSRRRDASKVALTHLVARLIAGGYRLLDTQFMTEHLGQFGAMEISRKDYHRRLAAALKVDAHFQVGGISSTAGGGAGAGGAGLAGAGLGGRDLGGGLATGGAGVDAAGVGGAGLAAAGAAGRSATGGAVPGAGAAALHVISQAS